MNLLKDFYRGLIIVAPYGTHIRKRKKDIIVKSKKVKPISNENLLLIENKVGLGIIRLGTPEKINLKQFDKLKDNHLISEEDRIKWWPKYKNLYMYPIVKSRIYFNTI